MIKERKYLTLVLLLSLIWSLSTAQTPSSGPDFRASQTNDCIPSILKFHSVNVDSSSQVDWVIKKDTFFARKKLTKLFVRAGQFDVEMIVHKNNGNTAHVKKQQYIDIGTKPNNLSLNPSQKLLCEGPGKVTFNAKGNFIEEWNWVVENKRYPKAGNQLTHKFETSGYKDVTIRVVNKWGCQGVKTFDSVVYIENPVNPDFNVSNTNGFVPFKPSFKSTNNRNDINQFKWQFPGANKKQGKGKNPGQRIYQKAGNYDVNLKVTTEKGCQFSTKKSELIRTADSIPLSFHAASKEICPNETLRLFNDSKLNVPGSFKWIVEGPENYDTVNKKGYNVVLEEPGKYDVLLIYRVKGVNQKLYKKDFIKVKNLKADFEATPPCNCKVPTTIQFKNKTQSPHTGNVTYEWTMWNKNNNRVLNKSYRKNPQFRYYKYGEYDVSLIAHHQNGCVDTAYKTDFVELEEFENNLKLELETQAINTPIHLGFPEDSFCSKDSLRIYWTIFDESDNLVKTSHKRDPYVTFQDSGKYDVRLKVSTKNGCKATSSNIGSSGDVGVVKPDVSIKTDTNDKILPFKSYCAGEQITLKENTSPEVLNYRHKWTITHQKQKSLKYSGWGEEYNFKIDTPGVYDVYYQAFVDSVNAFDTLRKGYLRIHGSQIDFSKKVLNQCLPYEAKVKSQFVNQYTYPSNVKRNYHWETSSGNAILRDTQKKTTFLKLNKAGSHNLHLTVEDTMGCKSTHSQKRYIKGGLDADFALSQNGCYKEQETVNNKSFESGRKAEYRWSTPDKSIQFMEGLNSKHQKVQYHDSGEFQLKLTMQDKFGCRDSQTHSVKVEKVFLDFKANDSVHHCAPSIVDFQVDASDNVKQYHWQFGDGVQQKTKKTNISHVYNKNSGGRNSGFDVNLKARTKHGCSKSLQKPEYITVIGPVPEFEMNTIKGCEPLNVSFKKTGKNYMQSFMDYDDQSNIDSSDQFQHQFKVRGNRKPHESFRPIMVAMDSQGCYALKKADKKIKVNQKPEAKLSMDTNKGCEPLDIQFKNETALKTTAEWDLNDNGSIDSENNTPIKTFQKGDHSIELRVKSNKGCRDTLFKKDALEVHETPNVDFSSTNKLICPEETVTFKGKAKTEDVPIKERAWFFEKEKNGDTVFNNPKTTQSYPKAGKYHVNYKVTNKKGCQAIEEKQNYVHSLDKIQEKPSLKFVSFGKADEQTMEINWEASKSKGFQAYHLIREDGFSHIKNKKVVVIKDKAKTQYKHLLNPKIDQVGASYKLTIEGKCGFFTDTSKIHSVSKLQVKTDSHFTNDLSWKAYEGWNAVGKYRILRGVEGGKSLKTVATVDGDKNQYSDKGLCSKKYNYKVAAVHENRGYASYSNQTSQIPEYKSPEINRLVTRSTVQNGEVLTEWNEPKGWNPDHYVIDRKSKHSGNWEIGFAETQNTHFKDDEAKTKQRAYTYRIRAANHCGDFSNFSNKGTSIHLKTSVSEDKINLDWNPYKGWQNGVKHYTIKVKKGNDGFKKIAQVNGNQTQYADKNIHDQVDTAYGYKVIATGRDDKKSVSNAAWAVMPSRVFVPDAFSPNDDGLNDEFKIVGNSLDNFSNDNIREFEMQVYNRWGEQIFKTNDMKVGWKGNYKDGKKVPKGSYIYKVKAYALDGKAYFLKGEVKVIR